MHWRVVISFRTSSLLLLIVAIMISSPAGKLEAQIMKSPSRSTATEKTPELHWPKPGQLLKEIAPFEENEATAQWAARTKELVEYLCKETEVSSQDASKVLMSLSEQSQAIGNLIGEIAQRNSYTEPGVESAELISELQRFQYRFNRRIQVWAGVIDHSFSIANQKPAAVQQVSLSGLPRNLDRLLEQQIPGNTGWQDYLAWDALVKSSRATNMDKKARKALRDASRKFLARYHSPSLSDAQRELFQPFFSPDILNAIRANASADINYSKVMKYIELMEREGDRKGQLGKVSHYLNSEYQNLLWSDDPIANELAALIESHWRNANFRIAVNERFLNQMLPQMPATTEPVSERIQGAKVSGQSLIENQLQIKLIPNPNEISLGLETIGQVTSDTVAQSSGFTFQNRGLADFKVFQVLAFSRTGVTSEEPYATSNARQRLIGLRGSYDRVPIIGWLTRKIAKQKVEEQAPQANKITEERVESGAKERVEQEVNQMVHLFRRGLHQFVLSKLIAMDLEPETVQLSTSQDRITGRYRLAGRDQMAAWQPRPTDFESDLLTVQFHQSAINNLIQRFGLKGKTFDPITLGKHVEKITGIPYTSENKDADATFEFDEYDPVRVDFKDGIASVKFSFKKFQIGKGRPWKNISVQANFKPSYMGTRIVLDRDSLFEVESKRDLGFTDEVAIRAAFKVILDEQYAFDIVPEFVKMKIPNLTLGIDRLSLAEGWCGVALDNASALNQPVPIVAPEEVVPGTWSDQLGNFQMLNRIENRRTARRLGY